MQLLPMAKSIEILNARTANDARIDAMRLDQWSGQRKIKHLLRQYTGGWVMYPARRKLWRRKWTRSNDLV